MSFEHHFIPHIRQFLLQSAVVTSLTLKFESEEQNILKKLEIYPSKIGKFFSYGQIFFNGVDNQIHLNDI